MNGYICLILSYWKFEEVVVFVYKLIRVIRGILFCGILIFKFM